MLPRPGHLRAIETALRENPACALLGPRQCGKTTLAREFARKSGAHYFDLETASGRARLQNPELTLGPLERLVIIDEVQRLPGLFATLRPLVDRRGTPARFLLLGSASPGLVRGASESLAGRVGFVELGGFDLSEVGAARWVDLWLRGGFPRSYLARGEAASTRWRRDFIRTFLERDIPQLGIRIPAEALRRFWTMLAHYHGQIWNGAELARAFGLSENTVRGYLDILAGAFVVRRLPPWFQNLGKRQFKAPKVYVRDSGLLHRLLAIDAWSDLLAHPKYGASWEGFALEQILALCGAEESYYWGTHAGAELDLLLVRGRKRFGFEFKASDAPAMTKSLHVALEDLKLNRAWIVYPGKESYPVHERVQVTTLPDALRALASLANPGKRSASGRRR